MGSATRPGDIVLWRNKKLARTRGAAGLEAFSWIMRSARPARLWSPVWQPESFDPGRLLTSARPAAVLASELPVAQQEARSRAGRIPSPAAAALAWVVQGSLPPIYGQENRFQIWMQEVGHRSPVQGGFQCSMGGYGTKTSDIWSDRSARSPASISKLGKRTRLETS